MFSQTNLFEKRTNSLKDFKFSGAQMPSWEMFCLGRGQPALCDSSLHFLTRVKVFNTSRKRGSNRGNKGSIMVDKQITTNAGDIVLYSGNQIVVFYGSNSWAYTRLGRITDKTASEMADLLDNGNVRITISSSL